MRKGLVGALMASTALFAVPALAQQYHYVKVAEIHLPCPVGHGDIVTYDPTNQMVYVSMKQDGLAVIDTRTQKVVHVFKDIPQPNANYFDDNYIYVAAAEGLPQGMSGANNGTGFGTKNELVTIDKHTWKVTSRVETYGTTPDGIVAGNGRVYVVSDDNNWMEAYTAGATPKLVGVWPLYPYNTNRWWLDTSDGPGPDVSWLSTARHKIYQSDATYVEVLNSDTGAIETKADTGVELTGKGGTKGSWLDEKTNLLWVATTTKKGGLLVLNGDTLKEVKRLPASSGKDQVSVDPDLGIVYTFGGSGFDAYDIKTMQHIAYVNTHVGTTHSGDVSDKTHEVYAYEGKRAALGVYKPVPGPGPNGDWAQSVASAQPQTVGAASEAQSPPVAQRNYEVYFALNSAQLTSDSRAIVQQAASAARRGHATRIDVTGHTDTTGTSHYNQALSMRRADAVRDELVRDGVPASQIMTTARGEQGLAVPTADHVNEPRNRRVEIVVPAGASSPTT